MQPTNKSQFGDKIKELRKKAHMTQAEIAEKANITKSVVSFYETGNRAPSPEVLIRFTEIFDVTSDYLLGIEKLEKNKIDVSGLSQKEVVIIQSMVDALRKKNI